MGRSPCEAVLNRIPAIRAVKGATRIREKLPIRVFSTSEATGALFRKTIAPIVPDTAALTYEDKRYYKPYVYFCAETDPSWYDISWFNFAQVDPDILLKQASLRLEEKLIPMLTEAIELLDKVSAGGSRLILDLHDRLCAFRSIAFTEKVMLRVQYLTHEYADEKDPAAKERIRALIRQDMTDEIENTGEFIRLLRSTDSVLVPTTSGEETPFMYKTPLDNLLKRKIIAMKRHLDDEPKAVTEFMGVK